MALHFELASPEKLLFSGSVEQVDVPGLEGDFGVLEGHAPMVATLRPGILTVHGAGGAEQIVVLGGFAEVSEKGLTVVADPTRSRISTRPCWPHTSRRCRRRFRRPSRVRRSTSWSRGSTISKRSTAT
jgi:hypothetical protein